MKDFGFTLHSPTLHSSLPLSTLQFQLSHSSIPTLHSSIPTLHSSIPLSTLHSSLSTLHSALPTTLCRLLTVQPLAGHFVVVQRQAPVADDLIRLVSFAGDQHAVARPGRVQRPMNGRRAVANHLDARAGPWKPSSTPRKMASRSSWRGLSLVKMANRPLARPPGPSRDASGSRARRRHRIRKSAGRRSRAAGPPARWSRRRGCGRSR